MYWLVYFFNFVACVFCWLAYDIHHLQILGLPTCQIAPNWFNCSHLTYFWINNDFYKEHRHLSIFISWNGMFCFSIFILFPGISSFDLFSVPHSSNVLYIEVLIKQLKYFSKSVKFTHIDLLPFLLSVLIWFS